MGKTFDNMGKTTDNKEKKSPFDDVEKLLLAYMEALKALKTLEQPQSGTSGQPTQAESSVTSEKPEDGVTAKDSDGKMENIAYSPENTFKEFLSYIEEFSTQPKAEAALKYWREKLFLNDWIISVKVGEFPDMIERGVSGNTEYIYEQRVARIRILSKELCTEDMLKYNAEKILVHELLHLKYNVIANTDTYEGKQLDIHEHSLLEQMAKTLIMVKYGLDLDYFRNGRTTQESSGSTSLDTSCPGIAWGGFVSDTSTQSTPL